MKSSNLNTRISEIINGLLASKISRHLFEDKLKKYIYQKIVDNKESDASKVSRQLLKIRGLYNTKN